MDKGRGVARSNKVGWTVWVECGEVSPPKSGGSVWGYNLKLISMLHNDSIPETPPGKKVGWMCHPTPPCGNTPGQRTQEQFTLQ